MMRRILVPLDGSPFGEQVLPLAAALAAKTGAELELVEVYHQHGHSRISDEETSFDFMIERLRGEMGVTATSTLLSGPVAEKLEAHAGKVHPDCVAMTTHGRGAIARACLGSVAAQLVKHLTVPILLLRPQEIAPHPNLRSATLPKRILAPFEGTEALQPRLDRLIEWAGFLGASLTLFQAVVPVQYLATETMWTQMDLIQDEMSHSVAAARTEMEQAANLAKERGIDAEAKVVVSFNPATAILDEAKRTGHDLIAMGTHGRHGIALILMGSIADQVVHNAAVPILIDRAAVKSMDALAESAAEQASD